MITNKKGHHKDGPLILIRSQMGLMRTVVDCVVVTVVAAIFLTTTVVSAAISVCHSTHLLP